MARNDYQNMASSFLDLWQEQITRSLSDRDFIHAMLDSMKKMQGQGSGAFRDNYESKDRDTAASSGIGADELDDLRRRLADCERRLAALESSSRQVRKAPAKQPERKGAAKKPSTGAGRAGR